MDRLECSDKKLVSSIDYLTARGCYERILEVDPGNARAQIDLGDHYRNLDANDKALEYYREAVRVLRQAPRDEAWKENVGELHEALGLLKKYERLTAEASSLEAWCKQALADVVA